MENDLISSTREITKQVKSHCCSTWLLETKPQHNDGYICQKAWARKVQG